MHKLCIIFFALLILIGCSNGGSLDNTINNENGNCDWLYLVYVASDNNLGDYNDVVPYKSRNVINVLEDIEPTNKVVCVVFFDEKVSNTKQYLIKKDNDLKNINSECIYDYNSNVDSGDVLVFENFVKMNIEKFRPNNVVLDIWDHGTGPVYKSCSKSTRGICYDSDKNSNITIRQLKSALLEIQQTYGFKIKVLVLSACFMGNYELLYELRNCAKYILASPPTIWGYFIGYFVGLDASNYKEINTLPFNPHGEFLKIIQEKNTPLEMINDFYSISLEKHASICYKNDTCLSVYDADNIQEIQNAFVEFSKIINSRYDDPAYSLEIEKIISKTSFYQAEDDDKYNDLKDFGSFVSLITNSIVLDSELVKSANKLKVLLYDKNKFIINTGFYAPINTQYNWNDCCGVSIYLPSFYLSSEFLSYDVFVQNEDWKQFIIKRIIALTSN